MKEISDLRIQCIDVLHLAQELQVEHKLTLNQALEVIKIAELDDLNGTVARGCNHIAGNMPS